MFASFFPNPKIFFPAAILWTALSMTVWYVFARDLGDVLSIGNLLGFPYPPADAKGGDIATDAARNVWLYQYMIVAGGLFIALVGWLQRSRWFWWSAGVSAVIIFFLWFRVQLDVMINNWFGVFYNTIQQALAKPGAYLDLAALQRAQELRLVVAHDAQAHARRHEVADDPQRVQDARPAIDEVAQEHGRPALRVAVVRAGIEAGALPPLHHVVAERREQLLQLVGAAVDVADDVERPGELALVVPQRLALDLGVVDLVGKQHPDVVEALLAQAGQRAAERLALPAEHMRAELPVRSRGVAPLADRLGDIEHDRDRQQVMTPGELDEWLARLGLDVGRVDDREPAGLEALAGDVVERVERRLGRRLVVLVVGDQAAEGVGRQHLGGQEVAARERRLAGPGRAHEDDQGQGGDLELHRENTAS